jgi:hypothetical protein
MLTFTVRQLASLCSCSCKVASVQTAVLKGRVRLQSSVSFLAAGQTTHVDAACPQQFWHVCCVAVCLQDAAPCSGELLEAIKAKWGSLDNFTSTFNTTTAAVQVRTDLLWKAQLAAGVAQRASKQRRHPMVALVATASRRL